MTNTNNTTVVETTVVETTVVENNNPLLKNVEVVETQVVPSGSLTAVDKKNVTEFVKVITDRDNLDASTIISNVGSTETKKLASLGGKLKEPIANLMNEDNSSSKIGNSLIELRNKVEEINPGKLSLQPTLWEKMLFITGASKMKKYFVKFQSSKGVIEDIVKNLQEGQWSLKEDNALFKEDMKCYNEQRKALQVQVAMMMEVDAQVEEKIKTASSADEKNFLESEVLFRVRQHTMDLQQTLAVTEQGILSLGILVKNNEELIRSVERTNNVTVAALSIGVTVALGLQSQKRVLDTVEATNSMTNEMIKNNSQMLKDQGAAIQKRAASAMLDVQALTDAMNNCMSAIDDINTFRVQALPNMKDAVAKLNGVNSSINASIEKMERGDRIQIGG